MSDIEQMTTAKECMQVSGCRSTEVPMPIMAQFWQYAKEAILSASYAKTDEDKQGLLDLARTWTQAALLERHSISDDGPAETSAA